MIDLHAHILPGLDDGPKDMSESLEMCRQAVAGGVTTIVATPHMNDGVYNVTRNKVLAEVIMFREVLDAEKIALTVEPGGDVHISSDLLDQLKDGNIMTLGDRGKYVMLELPSDVLPDGLLDFLFSVQLAGVTPIISHLERNFEVQTRPEMAQKLVEGGNLVQVTAASVVGEFGSTAERCSHELLKRRLAHVVASDMHSIKKRPPGRMSVARRVVEELLSVEEAEEIFINRPEKILAGHYLDIPDPAEWSETGKGRFFSWLKGM